MKNTIATVGILSLMLIPAQFVLAEEDCGVKDELRHYSGHIAKWLGIDPLADKYPDVSPYAYCEYNPLMYVDPNGEKICWGPLIIEGMDVVEKYLFHFMLLDNDSPYFSKLYEMLDASRTIFYISVNTYANRFEIDEGFVHSFYDFKKHTISFKDEYSLRNRSEDWAEEFFHAYQQDNIGLYQGAIVNLEFEAKVFVALVGMESSGCGCFYDSVTKIADAIMIDHMDVTGKEFEKLYNEQCGEFIDYCKKNKIGNKNYIKPNEGLPYGLISVINALEK